MGKMVGTTQIKSGALFALMLIVSGCASQRGVEGAFAAPVPQLSVNSPFGMRAPGRPHYGVDLRAPSGTPIASAEDGRVIFAGWMGGFGRLVKVRHKGEVETWYAHLSKFTVQPGSRVYRGQTIGFAGASGNATGAHLHFEIRHRGKPVDPLLYLNTRPRG